jgi:glycosyltransferase involved in cell wall biosynthesis
MKSEKRISIILPSFNDPRIVDAIESVRRFDDIGTVLLVVIDGGSKPELRDTIRSLLNSDDIFESAPDRGIFDALNKGLEMSATEYIGWLGSDDLFTGQLLASGVLSALKDYDLLVANLALFRNDHVIRISHGWPSRLGLAKYGLNNPHFATFGKSTILKAERFDLRLRGADIAYFLEIFAKRPKVIHVPAVATLMNEGGFSTRSYGKSLEVNLELMNAYAKQTNLLFAPVAVLVKLSYKFWSNVYYRVFPIDHAQFLKWRGNGSESKTLRLPR